MTTLARERAVASMYVLGGDDDLLDGMLAAQDMGVQVTVLGVEATVGRNQSGTLLREADDHIVLNKEFWSKYISPAPESEDDGCRATPQPTAKPPVSSSLWPGRQRPLKKS